MTPWQDFYYVAVPGMMLMLLRIKKMNGQSPNKFEQAVAVVRDGSNSCQPPCDTISQPLLK